MKLEIVALGTEYLRYGYERMEDWVEAKLRFKLDLSVFYFPRTRMTSVMNFCISKCKVKSRYLDSVTDIAESDDELSAHVDNINILVFVPCHPATHLL